VGLASISFDITEAKEAERLAISEKITLSAAQMKSQFLAAMSHEIRAPVGGILGVARLLAHSPLSGEARALVSMMRDSGEALLTVVDNILHYANLEAGRVTLRVAPLALRPWLAEQLEHVADAARDKGLQLRLEVDSTLPDSWAGDAEQLAIIVQQFLSNGIKFTERGHVTLRCQMAPPGPAPLPPREAATPLRVATALQLRLCVTDSGVGIAPELQGSVFQPFMQADVSHTRPHGGTGLGLSICRALAQLMDGNVGYTSQLNQGTEVYLDVPLTCLPQVEPAAAGMR
jgi:signal transduction histidine kinase